MGGARRELDSPPARTITQGEIIHIEEYSRPLAVFYTPPPISRKVLTIVADSQLVPLARFGWGVRLAGHGREADF